MVLNLNFALFRMKLKNKIKRKLRKLRLFFKKENYGPKVFCIGFNKTGTTTLGKSLEMLGYKNSSFNLDVWKDYKAGKIDKVLKYTSKFDSFDDLPWLREEFIPILDKTFPSSKFIYLDRDEESWKKSIYRWRTLKELHYSNEEDFLQRFNSHKSFVMDYFKNRNEDFTIVTISDKEGFKKLATFLNTKAPQDAFPHFNKTDNFEHSIKKAI
jgi:hypothetical protein